MRDLWELIINTPDGEIYNLNPHGSISRYQEKETIEMVYKEFGRYISRNSPQGEVCDSAAIIRCKNCNTEIIPICKTCLEDQGLPQPCGENNSPKATICPKCGWHVVIKMDDNQFMCDGCKWSWEGKL